MVKGVEILSSILDLDDDACVYFRQDGHFNNIQGTKLSKEDAFRRVSRELLKNEGVGNGLQGLQ
jgi:hypothetical protein